MTIPLRAVSVVLLLLAGCQTQPEPGPDFSTKENVVRIRPQRFYTPANQILTPAGRQVELPGLRPQALALSPDGRLLVTAGKTHELVVIEPASGNLLQRVSLPTETNRNAVPNLPSERILQPGKEGELSFTGLTFSPD